MYSTSLICFCLNCVLVWMGDIKAAKIAFLINQPFPLIYFPFAHMPVRPHESVCECVRACVLAGAQKVVRSSCRRTDNGPKLGVHLLFRSCSDRLSSDACHLRNYQLYKVCIKSSYIIEM